MEQNSSENIITTELSDRTKPSNTDQKDKEIEQGPSESRRMAVVGVGAILAIFEGVCMSLPGPPMAKKSR